MSDKILEGFPLSPQQKHLWLLQQTQQSLPYRAQCAIWIEGSLDTNILKATLGNVIQRHEMLRTTFGSLPEMTIPFQVITANGIPSVCEYDLSGWGSQQQQSKVTALCDQMSQIPFDFEKGPLMHVSLAHLSLQKHMLIIHMPALCADTVSLNNLVREISSSYTCLNGRELTDKWVQYVDFSQWQNELIKADDDEVGVVYWRKKDISVLSSSSLPFENQLSKNPGFEPQFLDLTLDADVSTRIKASVQEYGTSVSAFLLSCWGILLCRLIRQPNIVIGVAADGRDYEGLEQAIGLYAKYLPLNFSLEGGSRFTEILEQVHKGTRESCQQQEYFNWESIAGSVDVPRMPQFIPYGFDFEERQTKFYAADLTFSIHGLNACVDRFNVQLSCVLQDEYLIATFRYDANRYQEKDIKLLAEQFHTLVENAGNNPEAAISELEIVSDTERLRLVEEWNGTHTDYSKDKCVHQLFEEQAERMPNSIAVVYEGQQLTYRELNCRANQLARYLQGHGVGPETLVALCVERSLEMVVGLLGVLKAGGAYVALDPALPKDRLAFMVEDTQAAVLLTQQGLVEGLPEQGARVVCLDTAWDTIAQQSKANIISRATVENLVYVLYTSGSTGRPKGIAVEHRQLLNYLDGILRRLDLPSGASFATISTFAADLGNTAIFPSLCTGGCLHVVSQERASDPAVLSKYFTRYSVDCLKIVPSHLAALMDCSDPRTVLPRKRLVLGGEAADWELIKRVQSLAPECVVLNHYGPTETTVGVITYQVEKGQTASPSATLPIGRPITNIQIYVLDGNLQPVPIWAPGELYIGGDSVTRGYLNRPELTAEKFLPNPFSIKPGARLYRTGDLARYQSDGNIEFLGRVDHQVKIRGFRIELGEVEAVLGQHPALREAVVVAREDFSSSSLGLPIAGEGGENAQSKNRNLKSAEKRLVAYVVARQEHSPSTHELRSFLKEKLPDYMIPSAFVFLHTLPLTPNGKIDRRAFPEPDAVRPELEDCYVAPRNSTEELVAQIWSDVLQVERVGIYDDFFDLGGHSLLATQIVSRLREALGVGVSLRVLFERPKVAGLADYILSEHIKTQQTGSERNTIDQLEIEEIVL